MDENQLYQMLMGEYNNPQPAQDYISTASANINNLTRKRARNLMSQYSTTGMGRSGIEGAALNDVYSNAGQNLSQVAAQGEQMRAQERQNALHSLLGLYEFNQQNNPSFGQILGGIGGTLAGSLLGPVGAGIGGSIGRAIFGGVGNSKMVSGPGGAGEAIGAGMIGNSPQSPSMDNFEYDPYYGLVK